MNKIYFESPFGEVLVFKAYDYATDWNKVGGIYMLCQFSKSHLSNELSVFYPLYIGKTHSLKERLVPGYENWEKSARIGATKALILIEESETRRRFLEASLINYFDPIINKQKPKIPKSLGLGLGGYAHQNQDGLGLGAVQAQYRNPEIPSLGGIDRMHHNPTVTGLGAVARQNLSIYGLASGGIKPK